MIVELNIEGNKSDKEPFHFDREEEKYPENPAGSFHLNSAQNL